ncbi:MAG: urease accessory protein UreE [Candidatus Poribacteria bacterium]|nr:urease accessory protein UreE [Candidatus Poribacteria bacterium]
MVERIVEPSSDESMERDVVRLTWEERQKSRQRLRTVGGVEIGLALPTGTVLTPGDRLYQTKFVEIVVEGARESVFVLRPQSLEDGVRMAHQIGNLHRTLGMEGDAILVPHEPTMERQFERLGFEYVVENRVFTPISRAAAHVHPH